MNKTFFWGKRAVFLGLWVLAYAVNQPFSAWLAFDVLGFMQGARAGEAVAFFLYDTVKILLLLGIMVYGVAFVRAGLHPERLRAKLAGTRRGVGYLLGAGLGAVTPFCSCSSIPLFVGFTTAGLPFGISMAFLITSPMLNEMALVLLGGLLGWSFALAYALTGILAGVAGGFLMDVLGAERWLQPLVRKPVLQELRPSCACGTPLTARMTLKGRDAFARAETGSLFRKVAPWVVVGVGAGALLHGYVPEAWVIEHLGAGQWWSVPLAVLAGMPLYANVTGIVPIMESLLLKGVPAGTALAFCISTVAVSLPEILMLRQVMRGKLLLLFLAVVLVCCTLAGWLFNVIPFAPIR